MNKQPDYSIYQSVFSWRYGSSELRELFSDVHKRKMWRAVWVSIAKAQNKAGLISSEELRDIAKHKDQIDINAAHKIEAEISHDLMAELKTFSSQAKVGGGKIHLGATSQDIEDNADALIFQKALNLIKNKLFKLLKEFLQKIEKYQDTICMAYTHLQPAEPTTLGYRFSLYAQDLLLDLELLNFVKSQIKGKGIKGAVGTYASYVTLVGKKAKSMEEEVMKELGISSFDVTGQVYPRKIDFWILTLLGSISQSAYKFALDVRVMQSAGFGEWAEPFAKKQVGSSAMPFKRNPIVSEKICSIARYVSNLQKVAWDNAANSTLERTLDDSASRRIIIPDSFLATDEILISYLKVISGLVVKNKKIENNLNAYGPFASLEAVLMQSVKKGANRQEMHEVLRNHALNAYEAIENGLPNPLFENLKKDVKFSKYLSEKELDSSFDYSSHIGLSSENSALVQNKIKKVIS